MKLNEITMKLSKDKTVLKVKKAFDAEMEYDNGRAGWQWQGRLKIGELLRIVATVTGDNRPEVIKNTAQGDLYKFKGVDIMFPKSSKKFVKILGLYKTGV